MTEMQREKSESSTDEQLDNSHLWSNEEKENLISTIMNNLDNDEEELILPSISASPSKDVFER